VLVGIHHPGGSSTGSIPYNPPASAAGHTAVRFPKPSRFSPHRKTAALQTDIVVFIYGYQHIFGRKNIHVIPVKQHNRFFLQLFYMPLFYIPNQSRRRLGELPCTPAKPVGIKSKRLHPVWILNSHSLLRADAGVIGYGDGIVTGIQKAVRTETSFFKIFYIIKAVVLSPGIPAARIIPFPVIPVFVIPKAIVPSSSYFVPIFYGNPFLSKP